MSFVKVYERKSDIFIKSSSVIKHIQNFRGIENNEKKLLIVKMPKTLVAHQNYKEVDYMRHFWIIVKTHTFFRLFQYLLYLY